MPNYDRRIDDYIAQAADFAQPILKHLRKLVHAACPEVEETMKWSFPHFLHQGMLCSMAAFKQHCVFGFWKAKLLAARGLSLEKQEQAMGHFGRITALSDLPSDKVLLGLIKQAVRLNEEGVAMPPPPKKPKQQLMIPDYFQAALRKNRKALNTFESFTYSHKKEYLEWVTEAKREETRDQRLSTAIAWMAEGKPRNWKYLNC